MLVSRVVYTVCHVTDIYTLTGYDDLSISIHIPFVMNYVYTCPHTNRVAGENVGNFELCELWLFRSLSSMRKQLSTTNSKSNEGRQEKNGGVNTLTAKDGDLRLSAPNVCLPKTVRDRSSWKHFVAIERQTLSFHNQSVRR